MVRRRAGPGGRRGAPGGAAHIAVGHLGTASTLDPEAARRLAGPDADARAYLLLRPYLKRAVRVEILDPADPTPYWLVATRRPETLVSALRVTTTHSRPRRWVG